jgi:hypothetical protein
MFRTTISEVRKEKCMHSPGIEPGTSAWKADILPLNYECFETLTFASDNFPYRFITVADRQLTNPLNQRGACTLRYSLRNNCFSHLRNV